MLEHIEPVARRDSRGRYYVVEPFRSVVKVYRPDGGFLQLVGQKGAGPGEYEGIAAITVGIGDTLHVFDRMLQRYSVVSPDYRHVRSAQLPIPPSLRSIRTDSYVLINTTVRTPDRLGLPVHVVTPNGELLRSVGSATGIYRPDIPDLDTRAMTVSGDTVWAAHRVQYQIDRIAIPSGRVLQTLVHRPAWFSGVSRPAEDARLGAPRTMLLDVRLDSLGRMWLLSTVPDPGWMDAVSASPNGADHINVANEHRYRDSRVDVIDPASGRLITSARLDKFFHQFVDDRLLASVEHSASGEPRLAIWKVDLRKK